MSEPQPATVSEYDPTQPWSDVAPGRLVERLTTVPTTDRYEVGVEIARGGMGAVHRCHDRLLDRDLAVKVILPAMADRPEAVRRFVEEAQVGGRLQHPGVVPVHEVGRLPDGRLFFTMKLVQGRTLAQELRARPDPTVDLPRFVKVFEQVCQTVAYAHSQGVIHRDLKPHNVMVGAFGEVQVMDWGLAKILASRGREPPEVVPGREAVPPGAFLEAAPGSPGSATQAGAVLGTFAYMPPEQARGEIGHLDRRGDVFGLGAVLCEILTGQPPYVAPTFTEMRTLAVEARLDAAFDRLDRCNADPELVALCKRCLAADPADRPADAGAVADAVTAHLAGVADRLRKAEVERAAAAARERADRARRRVTYALVGTVAVAVLLAGGVSIWLGAARRARLAQTAQAVAGPLGEARSLAGRADRLTPATLAEWRDAEARRNDALAAGLQAEQALAAGEADDATRADLDDLLPALRAAAAAATRNRAMLERLHAVSFVANDALDDDDFDYYLADSGNEDRFLYSSRRGRADYAAAFRDFGLDPVALSPSEVARALAGEAIRAALLDALTDWLRLTDPGPERDRLDAVVRLAEGDQLRRRVLDAARAEDRAGLLAVAADDATPALPLPLLLTLADALFDAEEAPAAIGLLRRAHTARPGEFWLSNKLGEFLMFTGSRTPVRVAEATRYFTAALVVRPGSAVARINLGDALTFLGAYDEALDTYRLAVAERGDLAFARTKLAVALAVAGSHDDALAESRRACDLRPNSGWVRQAHGSVCALLGRHDEAAEACRAAVARHPEVASYHAALGQALTELGQHDAAVAEHREAVRLRPSGSTWGRLAEALLQRNKAGDRAGARAAATEAVRLQPGAAAALLPLASVHQVEGRRDRAIDLMREAVRLGPHDSGAWWRLGEMLRRDRRFDEAAHALREAVRRGPPRGPRRAALLRDLAGVLAERGDLAGAVAACRDAVAGAPADPASWAALGDALRDADDGRGAAGAYHEALYLQPGHVAARTRLVDSLVEQGRFDDAVALCADAPEAAERPFRLRRARLLLERDRPEEALRAVGPLIASITKPDGAAWYLRGLANRRLGRLDEAISDFGRAIGAPPATDLSYVQASLDLGDALLERHAAEGGPDAARGHAYRAWALVETGLPVTAVAAYRDAVRLDPDNARHRVSLAETLLKAHLPEEALAAFDEALRHAPSDPKARRGRGVALHELGRLDEATRALEAALKAAKGDKATTKALAAVLRDRGAFGDAAELFDRADAADQAADCRRLADVAVRLSSVAGGGDPPPAEDLLPLAEAAAVLDRPAFAARLFHKALPDDDPAGDRRLGDRAIEAAVRAGCGEADGKALDDPKRAAVRRQALDRVRAAVQLATARIGHGANPDRATTLEVIGAARRWLRAPALAGVRDEAGLGRLPVPERGRWRAVWDEVAALLRLAELLHGRDDVSWEPDRP